MRNSFFAQNSSQNSIRALKCTFNKICVLFTLNFFIWWGKRSRSSVDGIVTRLRTGWSGVRISAGARNFYVSQNVESDPATHLAFCSVNTGVIFLWVRWPERKFNHLSPSNADAENKWSFTSPPHIFLHGLDKETLILH
jgi:hypothetical protein